MLQALPAAAPRRARSSWWRHHGTPRRRMRASARGAVEWSHGWLPFGRSRVVSMQSWHFRVRVRLCFFSLSDSESDELFSTGFDRSEVDLSFLLSQNSRSTR